MSPNVDDLSRSNFITKKDVDPPILVTIQSYEEVNTSREGADPEMRWALHFRELDKPWILNCTNGQIIRAMTGSDPNNPNEFEEWIGTQIVLYIEPSVMFGPKMIGGIRCRARRKPPTTPPRQQTEPDAPEPNNIPDPDPSIMKPLPEPLTGDEVPF